MPSPELSSDEERLKVLEARAAFKGLLEKLGCDLVEKAMVQAAEGQERGLQGVTMPSEDHSVMLVINGDGVSFSIGEWRKLFVPTDTATAAIAEMRAETAKPTP